MEHIKNIIKNFLGNCIGINEENNYNYFIESSYAESYEVPRLSQQNSVLSLNTYQLPSDVSFEYSETNNSYENQLSKIPWEAPSYSPINTPLNSFSYSQRIPEDYELSVSREQSLFYTTDSQTESSLYL